MRCGLVCITFLLYTKPYYIVRFWIERIAEQTLPPGAVEELVAVLQRIADLADNF